MTLLSHMHCNPKTLNLTRLYRGAVCEITDVHIGADSPYIVQGSYEKMPLVLVPKHKVVCLCVSVFVL